MAEDIKLPVQDDETKVDTAEANEELNDAEMDQVSGGGGHPAAM